MTTFLVIDVFYLFKNEYTTYMMTPLNKAGKR